MKNVCLFNYGMTVNEINKIDDNKYYFYIDYDKFYLLKVNRPKEDIIAIADALSKIANKYFPIVRTLKGELYFEYEKNFGFLFDCVALFRTRRLQNAKRRDHRARKKSCFCDARRRADHI